MSFFTNSSIPYHGDAYYIAKHNESEEAFRSIFQDLKLHGKKSAPRGLPVIELESYVYNLPPYVRFCNFESRKLKLDYVKREFLWYLRANKYDKEILDHASMWSGLVNVDGSINSNYGQYIFAKKPNQKMSQFSKVVQTLTEDKDSRRASIMILSRDHLVSMTNDVPCTYSMNFRIRENKLNMTVHMRSQDAVFGMGNDAPCFSFVHEMVYAALTTQYPDLELGNYTHVADSFHVYERHFELMERVADGDPYVEVQCPRISPQEVNFLQSFIHLTYGKEDLSPLPKPLIKAVSDFPSLKEMIVDNINQDGYKFSKWLTTFNSEK